MPLAVHLQSVSKLMWCIAVKPFSSARLYVIVSLIFLYQLPRNTVTIWGRTSRRTSSRLIHPHPPHQSIVRERVCIFYFLNSSSPCYFVLLFTLKFFGRHDFKQTLRHLNILWLTLVNLHHPPHQFIVKKRVCILFYFLIYLWMYFLINL